MLTVFTGARGLGGSGGGRGGRTSSGAARGGGEPGRFCDGLTRRAFIQVGGLALGGLSLPQLLEASSTGGMGGGRRSHKAVIMIYLPGGPPHQDMFDLKMDAPSEVRGEFKPIPTNVPGIEVCELFERLARRMDRLAVIRSLVGSEGDHASFQCVTGRTRQRPPLGGWPEMGCFVSKLQGPVRPAVPPFMNLAPVMQHRPYNAGFTGFLGVAHAPFRPNADARQDMVLDASSAPRLSDRRHLLSSFDRLRRDIDDSGMVEGMDAFQAQALEILTSSEVAAALDLEREDPRVRERYGRGTERHQGDGAPRLMEQFLLARRLVEAGVRCVTVSFSFWDWHGNNFASARENFPALDQGLSALLDDLEARNLSDDVTVVVWGEFGRTPRINKDAGRDHWPNVTCALLAGGGMRTGQVIGSTDRLGEGAKDRPVHFQEVFATLYHNLGIDVTTATVQDYSGRPQYLVDDGRRPLAELV